VILGGRYILLNIVTMGKNYIFKIILFCTIIITSLIGAQNAGDFQTAASGDWTNLNSWSQRDGSTWITPATNYPGQISGPYEITVLLAHTIAFRTTSTILHTGILNILGNLNLNVPGNGNPDSINLNTTEVNINGGSLNFIGTKVRLNLPSTTVIIITNNAAITASTCNNNNNTIYIGASTPFKTIFRGIV
jgi:hypothetical protein